MKRAAALIAAAALGLAGLAACDTGHHHATHVVVHHDHPAPVVVRHTHKRVIVVHHH